MEIPVRLKTFEGPLDLLLSLIEKNKVSIYDIPIVEITDQYMEYIKQLSDETLEVMSEFLVMAATLLDIKSRMLLPPPESDGEEEKDPREELVQKLLEYKMYKYLSFELRDCMDRAEGHFYKAPSIPPKALESKEPVDVDEILEDVTLKNLYSVFNDVIRRSENRIDPVRSRFGRVKKEKVNMAETMRSVEHYIFTRKNCTFYSLLELRPGKEFMIVSFLTVLELMKEGKIRVEQPETFADIKLAWVGEDPDDNTDDIAAGYE